MLLLCVMYVYMESMIADVECLLAGTYSQIDSSMWVSRTEGNGKENENAP